MIQLVPAPYPGTPFIDIGGHWGRDAVKWAYGRNIFLGISAARFGPDLEIDRGMAAVALYRLAGSPFVSCGRDFSDVGEDAYYAEAVKWVSSHGIVVGSGGRYLPKSRVTREQLALMLYRYAQLFGTPAAFWDLAGFPDVKRIRPGAMEAMQWAVGAGIISGKGGRLRPKGSVTRAEAAAVLQRFAEGDGKTKSVP